MKAKMTAILFFCNFMLSAIATTPIIIPLWGKEIPGHNGISQPEETKNDGMMIVENISVPQLYVYLPAEKPNTPIPGVIICPGGSYAVEAIDHEGFMLAEWLANHGIAGIVLKYRLPNGNHQIPLMDAQQSMKVVNQNCKKWNLNPDQIGICGFSAGGHLASTLGTHYTDASKPDFMILFYPVISMEPQLTHKFSKQNLLGNESNNVQLQKYYSNHLHITAETPTTILFLNNDDYEVSPNNGILFYQELLKHKVNASLYLFPNGGHGWGMYDHFAYKKDWQNLLLKWFETKR